MAKDEIEKSDSPAVEKCGKSKKSSVKRTADRSNNEKKQIVVQPVQQSQRIEKVVSKSSTNKLSQKLGLEQEKLENEKIKNKREENLKETSNYNENELVPCVNIERLNNKNNSTKTIQKEKIVSPDEKIVEHFSRLDVGKKIPASDVVCEGKNMKTEKQSTRKLLDKNTVSVPKTITPSKIPIPTSRRVGRPRNKSNKDLLNQSKITQYYREVRRSERKDKKYIEYEKQQEMVNKIINQCEEGLEIKEFEGKGRGIITTKEFYKGEFVVEYVGNLIDGITAKKRETKYAEDKNIGCYMYYFRHRDRQYCIDATKESGKFGRLINHSRKGNLKSQIVEIDQVPHLVLFAKTDILTGTELLYDYGDRNPTTIQNHPWLSL